MEFKDLIAARHSVRHFIDREVDPCAVERILACAAGAPSSKNCKSTSFLTVSDRDVLEKMSRMRTYGTSFIGRAALAIVVLGDEAATDMWVENASIAATFIQLAAVDEGLGSCWAQVRCRLRDNDDPSAGSAEQYLGTILPIPEGKTVLCVIGLGYESIKE